jgi:hypothetical protein
MAPPRTAAILLTLFIGSAALAGCGSGGEVTLPTALPSGLERPTPSLTLPTDLPSDTRSPEAPTPTSEEPTPEPTPEPTSEEPTPEPTSEAPEESPTPTRTLSQNATSIPPSEPEATESESQTPEPTETDTAEPTESESESAAPSETASETPSESPTPTASATDSASPTATEASASAAADDSASSPLPLWLGLGALLAAGGALAWFLVARSKGKDWDERMEVERTQGRWVVAELVPALTNPATPPQMVAPHWATAQPTLDELEANVAALVIDAPDEARAAQARAIGAAITQVRSSAAAHVALVAPGTADPTTVATSAAAVQTARAQLDAALGNTP